MDLPGNDLLGHCPGELKCPAIGGTNLESTWRERALGEGGAHPGVT